MPIVALQIGILYEKGVLLFQYVLANAVTRIRTPVQAVEKCNSHKAVMPSQLSTAPQCKSTPHTHAKISAIYRARQGNFALWRGHETTRALLRVE